MCHKESECDKFNYLCGSAQKPIGNPGCFKKKAASPQAGSEAVSAEFALLDAINTLIGQWETDEEDMHSLADKHNALVYKGRGTQLGICAEQLRNIIKTGI